MKSFFAKLFSEKKNDTQIERETLKKLKFYYPSSDNYWKYPELTYSCANQFPKQLLELSRKMENKGFISIDLSSDFKSNNQERLSDLFIKNGSDKSTTHDYYLVYANILDELLKTSTNINILEIGIGTNNPCLISTMGTGGQPGASLRTFRDYSKKINVYGADIDRDILFEEERIVTCFCDQTKPSTFELLKDEINCHRFDLIIDDGLHSVEANLNTLLFALESLNESGYLIIEDIPERSIDAWKIVSTLIQGVKEHKLVKCKNAYIFLLRQ